MSNDPTFLGTVQDVQGATISIAMDRDTVSGLAFVNGQGYRIGQVGSFVRIQIGFASLYGVVSQVGAGAVPDSKMKVAPLELQFGNRWMTVQLVGEGLQTGEFRRGISQYPVIGDKAYLVVERDLMKIYGPGDPTDYASIGHLASAETIPALVNINKLITRHSAVVGATGSGKSTTVAGLTYSLVDETRYPSARILILDIHGEYGRALGDRSAVFRVVDGDSLQDGVFPLNIPFWALSFGELMDVGLGGLDDQRAAQVADQIVELKRETLRVSPREGVNTETVTVDTPVPFSIHKLWLELHKREHLTVVPKPGENVDEKVPAYVLDEYGKPVQTGDAMNVIPPQYRSVKTTGRADERVQWSNDVIGIRQPLASLASRLRDPRFNFLFKPGPWLPGLDGVPSEDLDSLLQSWIGGEKPVTILDLSGIPSIVLSELVGALLRIVYDSLFWARKIPEGGRERPLLVILEEAHSYLGSQAKSAATAVKRIAKEGRKYGVGIMLVSQRPSEIDPTILSQCGTIFAMRLANDTDRGQITSASSENLKGIFDMLPTLRTGEAIVVGEAVSLPTRALITSPPRNRRPDSDDPRVVVRGSLSIDGFDGAGGWNQKRDKPDYKAVVRQWRMQNPDYVHTNFLGKEQEDKK